MKKEILNAITSIYGKKFCRVRVGRSKSLSMGFGEKKFHNKPILSDKYYGEWEIGTYYGSWRIIKNNKIILGSTDSKDDLDYLNKKIKKIKFGEIVSITNISAFDVRVEFNNNLIVDFITLFSDDDEYFHIFIPDHGVVRFKKGSWVVGKSNVPWKWNGDGL